MKKLLLPICAVLMCMASCQKEEDDILNPTMEGNNLLTLVTEEYSSDAKLHLDNDHYIVWDDGDRIWLNSTEKEVLVDGTTATIDANMGNSAFTAIYPYDWATGGAGTSGSIGVEYPSTQRYEEVSTGVQKVVAPMAGTCTDQDSTLVLHNLGCILAVEMTNSTDEAMNIKKIEVLAVNGYVPLWGKYSIDYNDYSINFRGGGVKVTLDCGWKGVSIAPGSSKKFYIALPQVESAQLSVKVYDNYDYYFLKQASAHALERNHVYNAGITVDNSTEKKQYVPKSNQIMYTTSDGQPLDRRYFDYNGLRPVGEDYQVDEDWFITFSDSLTSIPEEAFFPEDYSNIFVSVTLPASVTHIGSSSFFANYLEFISMPGVVTIDDGYAIGGCHQLETVILGPNATCVGKRAFYGCENIRHFYCYAQQPPALGENVFERCDFDATVILHVPAGQEEAYRASGWGSVFQTIVGDLYLGS